MRHPRCSLVTIAALLAGAWGCATVATPTHPPPPAASSGSTPPARGPLDRLTPDEARVLASRPARAATPGCLEPSHAPGGRVDDTGAFETLPEPVTRVAPSYPGEARERRVDGMVAIGALVCEHGRVIETRVLDSIPFLDAASQEAVEQWKFTPGRRAERAVSGWVRVPVRFTLH